MTITIHADSHTDHNIPEETLRYVLSVVEDERADDLGSQLVIHTVHLPVTVYDPVPCALVGPATGFGKVPEAFVRYEARGDRKYVSRVIAQELVPTRKVTVIVGEHEGDPAVLFTAFGGPLAPKELGDPRLTDEERPEAEAFWAEHALADGIGLTD